LGEVVILHHVADLQIFVIDRVVRAHQTERRLVVEVLALAAHRLVRLRQQFHRLAPAMAALLARGYPALARRQVPLRLAKAARVVDHGPIGQGGEGFQTEVYPGLLARWGQQVRWHLGTGDGDVPAVGLVGYRDRLGRALDGAGPMHAEAPDLGEDES